MPIEFQCSCGKTLRVRDEAAGKQAKCPACQKVLTVPEAVGLADTAPAGPSPARGPRCAKCGEAMAEGAVICVKCGFNTETGAAVRTATDQPEAERAPTVVLPVGKIITVAVLVLAAALGYFFVVRPLVAGHKMSKAYRSVLMGDMEGALKAFEEVRPQLSGTYRDTIDLWDAQCRLEMEKNPRNVLSKAIPVSSDALELEPQKLEPAGSVLLVTVTVRNKGSAPLTLRNDYFYLRGVRDIVPVYPGTDNSLDGIVVPPGEAKEGIVVFHHLPHDPAMDRTGMTPIPTYHVYFNDGKRYVKAMLPVALPSPLP